MTQDNEQTDALVQLLEDEFSEEELESLENSILNEEELNAQLVEDMEGEIYVALNQFSEVANFTKDCLYDDLGISLVHTSKNTWRSNFLTYVNKSLSEEKDPYNDIFSVPRAMIFGGEYISAAGSAFARMSAIGGENMLLLDIVVDTKTNMLIVRFLPEANLYVNIVTVNLDLTDRNITHNFLQLIPREDQTANAINVQRSVLEFLIRFFYCHAHEENLLDSEDFQEMIIQKMEIHNNPIAEVILEINQIMDKYAEKKRREEFKKVYAVRGIEAW